ncbi:MAG: glycerophosphodiester phosphodiesterase [Lachnospiraceae bacterium]|nr:glycerophosphodiester phosphodiesterase [Lachnospiraceae bacterium]
MENVNVTEKTEETVKTQKTKKKKTWKQRLVRIVLWMAGIIGVLYMVLIMPRIVNKPDLSVLDNPLVAHRGFYDNTSDAPENSLKSFEKAIAAGYSVELDIQSTKDGVVVVFHDYNLKRMCGVDALVADKTYEEIKDLTLLDTTEHIPTLQEALDVIDGQVPLVVEYKGESTDTGLCDLADPILSAYDGKYCVQSFNPMILYWYRRNHKEVVRGQLAEDYLTKGSKSGALYWAMQNLFFNVLAQPDFISYNFAYDDVLARKICTGLYGNISAAWTVRSQEELESVKDRYDVYIFDSFVPVLEKE